MMDFPFEYGNQDIPSLQGKSSAKNKPDDFKSPDLRREKTIILWVYRPILMSSELHPGHRCIRCRLPRPNVPIPITARAVAWVKRHFFEDIVFHNKSRRQANQLRKFLLAAFGGGG